MNIGDLLHRLSLDPADDVLLVKLNSELKRRGLMVKQLDPLESSKRFLKNYLRPCELNDLIRMDDLSLNRCEITDITALTPLVQLKLLSLQQNKITDISALNSLVQLKHLYLNINKITDISALNSLVQLNSLDLQENKITDISALRTLYNLESLNLNGNSVTDISPLYRLNNLKRLYIINNPGLSLAQIQAFADIAPRCDIRHTYRNYGCGCGW